MYRYAFVQRVSLDIAAKARSDTQIQEAPTARIEYYVHTNLSIRQRWNVRGKVHRSRELERSH